MSNDYTISPLGLKLIKAFEGFRGDPTTLVTGQRVVGYGHPLNDAEQRGPITREVAEELLREDLEPVESLIKETIFAPLSQSQFDAICSLVFNIGPINFMSSNLRYALNNGRALDAAAAFDEWRKAEIAGKTYVVDALVRRRTAEKALFLRSEKGMIHANNVGMSIKSDDSYLRVSDEDALYDPEAGIVNVGHADLTKTMSLSEAPTRRREDNAPAGVLTLTERAEANLAFEKVNYADGNRANTEFTADEAIAAAPLTDVEEFRMDIPHPNAAREESVQTPSPIAIAAAEVSDRLDALIDTARLDAKGDAAGGDAMADDQNSDAGLVAANSNDGRKTKASQDDVSSTNDLASRSQPRGADAFIQREAETSKGRRKAASVKAANEGPSQANWIYGLFVFIGACLMSAGLVIWLTAMDTVGAIGQFFAPWSMVFGALLIVGGLYYTLRSWLRRKHS